MTEPEKAKARDRTFDELPLSSELRRGIRDLGYISPTPIQVAAIPDAVGGRDMVGTAQTGTGKTAAFLLPILERLMAVPGGRLLALVLTPTRELALQAEGFVRQLGRHTRLRAAAVYGGVGMGDQEKALRHGVEIIIATPGRLLDHMSRGYVDFSHLRILVLDEADRMLDMGFLPDVRRILSALPRQRQTMLFSATMPVEVVRLSRDFLHDPKTVQVGSTTAAAIGVHHLALPVASHRKVALLIELLRDETMTSVLVFARTKRRADRVARELSHAGLSATAIHGDRSQAQRVRALEGFREGHHRVLVATDIAARGIDVEGVSHVINLDVPHEAEVYIHRVGRTARAQRQGDALTLLGHEEEDDWSQIERLLGFTIDRARIPGFDYDAPSPPAPSGRASGGYGHGYSRRPPSRPAGRGGGPRYGGSSRRRRN
ncbi:MAG: DEAD/DEAH box helicase [Thermoplasmata archaeon]|nr:DEAD/DEAH box helicase [Thermoplasmata archaeon]